MFHQDLLVLIVPLWNWNKKDKGTADFHKSFNRTFMELKQAYGNWKSWKNYVLIVPLWNWNNATN